MDYCRPTSGYLVSSTDVRRWNVLMEYFNRQWNLEHRLSIKRAIYSHFQSQLPLMDHCIYLANLMSVKVHNALPTT